MWRFLILFLGLCTLNATAEIQRDERRSLLDSDPDVVYLDQTVKNPIMLEVIKEAPIYSTKEGTRQIGTLQINQTLKLEAMTEKAYRVRGKGVGKAVVGWVGPWAFKSKDPDFVENLKKLYQRQIEVVALIDANDVAIGMTLEEVTSSLGKPVKTASRKTANGETGKWEYIEYEDVKHYVTRIDPYSGAVYRQFSHITREEKSKTAVEFENNVVTAIERMEDEKGANVRIIVPPVIFRW
ncbi:hypothetical protein JIN85_12890 [Luteolibacter pohnpeiensis]|uniref:Uncharacterized protein n=1 Tax=Luteolibacter pohnpeiensis TaxID=454153 RepID=A0A934S652_9BACT|nr:hypothetical protein [Luteolibacter pohnpeiensis]MBK1883316.1 hypothetical protein [Luteolibacter pohnpeiensis]